jgi:hypothetical protein
MTIKLSIKILPTLFILTLSLMAGGEGGAKGRELKSYADIHWQTKAMDCDSKVEKRADGGTIISLGTASLVAGGPHRLGCRFFGSLNIPEGTKVDPDYRIWATLEGLTYKKFEAFAGLLKLRLDNSSSASDLKYHYFDEKDAQGAPYKLRLEIRLPQKPITGRSINHNVDLLITGMINHPQGLKEGVSMELKTITIPRVILIDEHH